MKRTIFLMCITMVTTMLQAQKRTMPHSARYQPVPTIIKEHRAYDEGVVRCGSAEHQKKVERFFDLLSHNQLTQEHADRYVGKIKRLFWGAASIVVLRLFFVYDKETTKQRCEELLNEVFSCTGSLAWLKESVESFRTKELKEEL